MSGKPGVSKAKSVRDALDALEDVVITVPVWDEATGGGNNLEYHVVDFARIQFADYRLPKQNRISAVFWGNEICIDAPVNAPPVTADDSATTSEGTPVAADVLANDSDLNGDWLTITAVSQPVNGTTAINPDNTISYTPLAGFYGAGTFTYSVSDGQGGVDTATVNVMIEVPDAWQYTCGDNSNLQVEVIGAGMGHSDAVEHNPQTLTIDNPDDVAFILAQVVVNSYNTSPPDKVTISSGSETIELLNPTNMAAGYHYEAILQPAGQITAAVSGNVGQKPRAFVAYVFRHSNGERTGSGELIHTYVYRNNHTAVIPIPAASFNRDVEVTFVVADLEKDSGAAVLRAQAGDVIREATVSRPNQGSELLIYTLTLADVPQNVDSVTTTLTSPSSGGDSLYWSGVNIATACSPASNGSGQGRVTENLQTLYTFQAGSGTTVYDVSGVNTPLNLEIEEAGAVSWLPGGGLAVNASTVIASDSAAAKVVDAAKTTNELTIEAWVRPAFTIQDGPARIVTLSADPGQGNFTLGQGLWGSQPANVYDVRLRAADTGDNRMPSVTTPAGSVTTDFNHIVYTRDAAGVTRIYVNNVEVANQTVSGDFSNWTDSYRLGLANELTENRPWLGYLHLVAIYNRALTLAEVSQNFDAGPGE